jgi:hypothetical protein
VNRRHGAGTGEAPGQVSVLDAAAGVKALSEDLLARGDLDD